MLPGGALRINSDGSTEETALIVAVRRTEPRGVAGVLVLRSPLMYSHADEETAVQQPTAPAGGKHMMAAAESASIIARKRRKLAFRRSVRARAEEAATAAPASGAAPRALSTKQRAGPPPAAARAASPVSGGTSALQAATTQSRAVQSGSSPGKTRPKVVNPFKCAPQGSRPLSASTHGTHTEQAGCEGMEAEQAPESPAKQLPASASAAGPAGIARPASAMRSRRSHDKTEVGEPRGLVALLQPRVEPSPSAAALVLVTGGAGASSLLQSQKLPRAQSARPSREAPPESFLAEAFQPRPVTAACQERPTAARGGARVSRGPSRAASANRAPFRYGDERFGVDATLEDPLVSKEAARGGLQVSQRDDSSPYQTAVGPWSGSAFIAKQRDGRGLGALDIGVQIVHQQQLRVLNAVYGQSLRAEAWTRKGFPAGQLKPRDVGRGRHLRKTTP